ncbi:hypothetical protein SEVIR_9G004950v4 [Setaria viridis]
MQLAWLPGERREAEQSKQWRSVAAQKIPRGRREREGRGLVFNPWKRAGPGPFLSSSFPLRLRLSPSPPPPSSLSPPRHAAFASPDPRRPPRRRLPLAIRAAPFRPRDPPPRLDLASIPRAPIRLSLAWVGGDGLGRGLLGPARVISPRAGSPLSHHAEDPVPAGAPLLRLVPLHLSVSARALAT